MNRHPLFLALLALVSCIKQSPSVGSTTASAPCVGPACAQATPPKSDLTDWTADYSHYSALDEGSISFTSTIGDADFPESLILNGANAGQPNGLFMFVRRRFDVAPKSLFHVTFQVDATVDFSKDCAKPVVIKGGAGDLEPLPVMSPDYMMKTSITQDPVLAHERFTTGGDVQTTCDAPQPNLVATQPTFAHALPARSAADGALWVYVGFETSSPEAIRIALKSLNIDIKPAEENESASEGIDLTYSFDTSNQGWSAGFADYPAGQETFYELESGARPLPSELGKTGANGFYLSGVNRSDDLLMYLWTKIGREQGLKANTTYRLDYTVDFASNVPQHCHGAGGAEGEGVTLKVGGSGKAPVAAVDPQGLLRLNWDIGSQTHGGSDASAAGHIANQFTCEEMGQNVRPYTLIQRRHHHTHAARTDVDGGLWLFVGTDSGFEARTSLFFSRIKVKLTPVVEPGG